MSQFTVRGRFQNRGDWSPFQKEIDAPNEDVARERAYALLGSEHNCKRTQVELEEVAR